jgi:hypothetical protein
VSYSPSHATSVVVSVAVVAEILVIDGSVKSDMYWFTRNPADMYGVVLM